MRRHHADSSDWTERAHSLAKASASLQRGNKGHRGPLLLQRDIATGEGTGEGGQRAGQVTGRTHSGVRTESKEGMLKDEETEGGGALGVTVF